MANRLFVTIVIALWLVAMSWLVFAKVLPPFGQGRPPSFRALSKYGVNCWEVSWNNKPVGWSATRISQGSAKTKEVHSRLILENVEFTKLPDVIKNIIQIKSFTLNLDSKSRTELDPLGNLSAISSHAIFSLPESTLTCEFNIRGYANKGALNLTLTTQFGASGDTQHDKRIGAIKEISIPITDGLRLGMELSNSGKLLGMYVGRKWQMDSVNPLSSSGKELIAAEVIRIEPIQFDGNLVNASRIEMRTVGEINLESDDSLKTVIWVGKDGTVLRQESKIYGSTIRFERMLDVEYLKKAIQMTASQNESQEHQEQFFEKIRLLNKTPNSSP